VEIETIYKTTDVFGSVRVRRASHGAVSVERVGKSVVNIVQLSNEQALEIARLIIEKAKV
jgi:hypothetical protein